MNVARQAHGEPNGLAAANSSKDSTVEHPAAVVLEARAISKSFPGVKALDDVSLTARLDSATPNAGLGYELDSIAAVVIGGTSLSGGRGSVLGTVLGCLIIGVLNNGLGWHLSPDYGGWGGRYALYRAYGETLKLSAEGTRDPDGHTFEVRWWIYPEASSLRDAKGRRFPDNVALSASPGQSNSLVAPAVTKPETIHVILQVEDRGTPSLFAYRRAILTIKP